MRFARLRAKADNSEEPASGATIRSTFAVRAYASRKKPARIASPLPQSDGITGAMNRTRAPPSCCCIGLRLAPGTLNWLCIARLVDLRFIFERARNARRSCGKDAQAYRDRRLWQIGSLPIRWARKTACHRPDPVYSRSTKRTVVIRLLA